MKIAYAATLAVSNLRRSKLRTWLTITGIVIGVAAVVLIISIGNGLQANVQSQLAGLGADVITVSPGFSRASENAFRGGGGFANGGGNGAQGNLTTRDLQAIKLVPNVKLATGTISGRETISFGTQTASAQIRGVNALEWKQFSTDTVASGRDLAASDANAVVIGSRVATQFFKRPLTVNTVVQIAGKSFRIVGILAEGGGFGGSDNTITMPIAQARQVITGLEPNQFSGISVKVNDAKAAQDTAAEIENRLENSRHVTAQTKDFTVTATQSIQERISQVTASISLFLGAIAAISLLVGAIGIANTMFMAVLERTRQIGVLKAIGATRGEITTMFLIESGILGLSGGLIGIALSLAIAVIAGNAGVSLGVPGGRSGAAFLITPELVFFALAFSAIIGTLAGYVPARQAASLKPVEALRYE